MKFSQGQGDKAYFHLNLFKRNEVKINQLIEINQFFYYQCFPSIAIKNEEEALVPQPSVLDWRWIETVEIAHTVVVTSMDVPLYISLKNPSICSINGSSNDVRVFKVTSDTKILQKRTNTLPVVRHEQLLKWIQIILLNPQFRQISATKGILLFGPSGTGKSIIMKNLKYCVDESIQIFDYNEADVGLSVEEKCKSTFNKAIHHQPAIILLDELDLICPKRDENSSESVRRMVSCFISLMDQLDNMENNQVLIIAATNRLHVIDEALRRPGRFDKELEIGIPDLKERGNILRNMLNNIPHQLSQQQLETIIATTHGYVAADLSGLVQEASLKAIQKGQEAFNIEYNDFLYAKSLIKPSAMREITLEIPSVKWNDIGGQEDIKEKLKQSIQWPLTHPEVFDKLGIVPPKGILLYGPPGCSKTLMAKALATESGLNFLAVKGPEIFNKWVGESERAIKEIFRKARAASPSIIFFDEIDAIATARSSNSGSSSVSDRVLTQLLTEMDGVEQLTNVTIVAATNRPDVIDAALMRPGRLDRILYVSPPDFDARLSILKMRTRKMPLSSDVDFLELARKMEGMSGAEVVAVTQEAAIFAMKECIDKDVQVVTFANFQEAFNNVHPRITKEMIDFYTRFGQNAGSRNL